MKNIMCFDVITYTNPFQKYNFESRFIIVFQFFYLRHIKQCYIQTWINNMFNLILLNIYTLFDFNSGFPFRQYL